MSPWRVWAISFYQFLSWMCIESSGCLTTIYPSQRPYKISNRVQWSIHLRLWHREFSLVSLDCICGQASPALNSNWLSLLISRTGFRQPESGKGIRSSVCEWEIAKGGQFPAVAFDSSGQKQTLWKLLLSTSRVPADRGGIVAVFFSVKWISAQSTPRVILFLFLLI